MSEITGTEGGDTLTGTAGDDTIHALGGNDQVSADGGNDTVYGGAGVDSIQGGLGNDQLYGGADDDALDGGVGADTLVGGSGNDVYVVDDLADVVTENAFAGTDQVRTDLTEYALGVNVERLTGTAGTGQILTGNDLANEVTGGAGNDTLYGLGGADILDGGAGDDILDGGADGDRIAGRDGNDTIEGGAGDDTIAGDDGNDTIRAGEGWDNISGGNGDDVIFAGADHDRISDGAGNDVVYGGAGFDQFEGSAGNDSYDGAAPGELDDEYDSVNYTLALAGIIVDLGAASDHVRSVGGADAAGIGIDQLANIEGVTGSLFADTMTGGAGGDALNGRAGNDVIDGAGGSDQLYGGSGDDTITGGEGDDDLFGDLGNDTIDGGAGDDFIVDGTGSDTVLGGEGSDTIFVDLDVEDDVPDATDDDIYDGGTGLPGEIDSVDYSYARGGIIVDLTAASNQVRSSGTADAAGIGVDQLVSIEAVIGSRYDDTMTGNSGDNILDGNAGNDTIVDGAGNDIIRGGEGSDRIIASLGGNDVYDGGEDYASTDFDSIDYGQALAGVAVDLTAGTARSVGADDAAGIGIDQLANFEDVFGSAFADQITGSAEANVLLGYGGNDALSGGGGNDHLNGGTGDDILDGGLGTDRASYFSSAVGVTVSLAISVAQDTGQGLDTLTSIENLTGSQFNDVLTGNAGANSLTGAGGADQLIGGAGNDAYVVDAADTIVENAGEGTDTVISSQSFTLSANLENLTLGVAFGTSGAQIITRTGTGNDLANQIRGTSQADILLGMGGNDTLTGNGGGDYFDGGAGADTMIGGMGADTYVVDNIGDVIQGETTGIDFPGDSVVASVSFDLGLSLENLTLTGTGDLNGTGNSYANRISGNAGSNILKGYFGNDSLYGGDGNDTLLGESDNDMLYGESGDDKLTGGFGIDTLTGGAGEDSFQDTAANLNGDTIADLTAEDRIVISDANLAAFTYSLSGNVLTYTGGSLTLTNVPAGQLVASAAAGGGVQITVAPVAVADARHDFNGDGRSDLAWRHTDGTFMTWLGQANGSFVSNPGSGANALDTSWRISGVGDFNGDGRDDILWRHSSGEIGEWLGQSSAAFANNGGAAANAVDNSWSVAGVADYNGDGRDDILWRHTSGEVGQWLGQPSGGFANNGGAAANAVDPSWAVVASGDFNGDGRDDILWRHSSGVFAEWQGSASGALVNAGSVLAGASGSVVGSGDFNGDGRDDVLMRGASGSITAWLGQSDGQLTSFTPTQQLLDRSWKIVGIGDYNGDGSDDLLWRHTSGEAGEWLATGTGDFAYSGAIPTLDPSWQIQSPDIFLV